MALPDLTGLSPAELRALMDAIRLLQVEAARESDRNAGVLRDAAEVDAAIGAVVARAQNVQTIIDAPPGQTLDTIEVGVKWLAAAVYDVGALTVRAARLAADRTDSTDTLPVT